MSDVSPPAGPSHDGDGKPPAPAAKGWRRLPHPFVTLGVVAVVVVAALATSAYALARHANSSSAASFRPAGVPSYVSTKLASLMELDSLPHTPAPGFTLTDQHGRTMSLSDFRGKVVVLEFMDPHCTDICPIVSQEFVSAYHDLGAARGKVVFAAVNVNQYYESVSTVAAFSHEHQLTSIPDWHFFTGATPKLKAAWDHYKISVEAPNPNGDIVHTSAVYFINQQGKEVYLAAPQVDHTKSGAAYLPADQITSWGHGIALLARHLAK